MKTECKYLDCCRVREKYSDLCFLNMSKKEQDAVGNSCVFEREYQRIPEEVHDLICPSGLVRKILRGENIKGVKL